MPRPRQCLASGAIIHHGPDRHSCHQTLSGSQICGTTWDCFVSSPAIQSNRPADRYIQTGHGTQAQRRQSRETNLEFTSARVMSIKLTEHFKEPKPVSTSPP